MSDDELGLEAGLFDEPEDFAPPPPAAHFADYERVDKSASPSSIKLRLVGKSPLWGHLLWNAGIYTANYLDAHTELYENKRVLELGAAAALPSLICGINKASLVVSTDYPDPDLISNIQHNVDTCGGLDVSKVLVKGFIWGDDIKPLTGGNEDEKDKFDFIILSDLVFNHTEHLKLLKTCRQALKKDGKCFVVFSPHRPWLLAEDLKFFETCEEFQFKAERNDLVNWKPMFEEDDETIEIRSRVYSYFLLPQW